jgi:three-Cys-motif partner protein
VVADQDLYAGREQSWIKHYVLRGYLERFAHIIGFAWPSITYIDGFSGPWNAQSSDFSDTSFSIALAELRKARQNLAAHGKDLRIRCVFLEKDVARFKELQRFASQLQDAEILALNAEFEDAISEIIRLLDADPQTFPFVFIDPTGWTGFAMDVIAPLLKRRCEVLVNFMLPFIRRFFVQDFTRESLSKLFGTSDFDAGIESLHGQDRDDAIADRYCRSLKEICGIDHVRRAVVLYPDKAQTHFQLIYGTRSLKGVEEFKKVEKSAMEVQERSRARVEADRERERGGGQQSFLDAQEAPDSKYYIKLRERYLRQSRRIVLGLINSTNEVPYDELWRAALSFPLVWASDLHGWLKSWRDGGKIAWEGLELRERTLKRGKRHIVKRVGGSLT